MKEFITNIKHEIEINIDKVESSENNLLERKRQAITYLLGSAIQLKSFILKYEFKTEDEEILFFKEIKPQIYSKLLFYVRTLKIEENKPVSSSLAKQSYFTEELRKLEQSFTNSLEFYRYYRMGSTAHDNKYFLRKEYCAALDKDPSFLEKDLNFATSCDYEVSNIIANDMLKAYLISRIKDLNEKVNTDLLSRIATKQMQWTSTKVSLVELAYGIHASKSVNYGNIDLKDLIKCFEIFFNIEMGDFYHTFLEIRERKKNRTQFIDLMRNSLVERMDNFDK